MLKKMLFMSAALGFMAGVAHADVNAVYKGTLSSRQQCRDSGGAFATDLGCKKLALQNRDCAVGVNVDSQGNYRQVQVEIPAAVQNGEVSQQVMSASLSSPYVYTASFNAYMAKLNRTSSMELKVSSRKGGVLAANVYVDHQFAANGERTYIQYECRNLKRIR